MMVDGMTVLVALFALCVVTMVLIWQVATLIGMMHGVQYEVHALKMWIAHMAQNDGDSDED